MRVEKQEKVWVVLKCVTRLRPGIPVKVFDDRQDARDYAKPRNARSSNYYKVVGVKKG